MISKCNRIKLEINKMKVTKKVPYWKLNNTLLNNPLFKEKA